MMNAALQVVASIPSPGVSYFDIGPLRIHFYALCIILGIIVAVFLTNARLTKRGAEPWVVIDICLLAIPIAIIGARIFHVLTHPGFYFGEGSDFWASPSRLVCLAACCTPCWLTAALCLRRPLTPRY